MCARPTFRRQRTTKPGVCSVLVKKTGRQKLVHGLNVQTQQYTKFALVFGEKISILVFHIFAIFFIMRNLISEVLFYCLLSIVLYSSFSGAQVKRFQTCGDVNLCCPGRNNTCYAFGPRMDGNFNETKCFCDDNCNAMKDCCVDHASFCDYQRGMYIVIPKLYFHPKKEQGHIKRTYVFRVFPFAFIYTEM